MAEYKELSRRGLIKLNNEFDQANDHALHNFLNGDDRNYEEVRPYEQIAEKMDEVTEAVQMKGGVISTAIIDRANHIFDSMIAGLTEEIRRCEDIMDEQEDDDSYPDEEEDEE